MAAPQLCDLWLSAPEGKLCAREQAKAWAFREAWRAEGKGVTRPTVSMNRQWRGTGVIKAARMYVQTVEDDGSTIYMYREYVVPAS